MTAPQSIRPGLKQHLSGLLGSLLWLGIARLPAKARFAAGSAVGSILYCLHKSRRSIVERNLELCFPEQSSKRRRQLAKDVFACAGRGVFSWGFALFSTDDRIDAAVRWHGKQALVDHLAAAKPVILLCPHFVAPMLTLRAVGLLTPVVAMYEPPVNPIFDAGYKCALNGQPSSITWLNWIYRKRTQQSINMISARGSMRPFYRALRQNTPFFYLPDQNAGRREHRVFAPFFGTPAATYTSLTRFAKFSNAHVFVCYSIMRAEGSGYDTHIIELPDDFVSGDPHADACRLNQTIEQLVRQSPSQYFWLHRRFKSRPAGEASLY